VGELLQERTAPHFFVKVIKSRSGFVCGMMEPYFSCKLGFPSSQPAKNGIWLNIDFSFLFLVFGATLMLWSVFLVEFMRAI